MGLLDTIGNVFSAISPIGSIASGVGSLVSGISGAKAQRQANETNLQIARENNQTSIDIARENNEFARQHAIDMFNMENAYNTPLEQVKRLQEAGLNPALVMEGAGGTAVGNSSGAGAISPSMPSLTTPHVEPVPPMAVGFLDALQSFANIKLANAQAGKAGAEAERTNKLVDQELLNLMAEEKWKQSQTQYQDLMSSFERLYGHDKRAADITKTISEFVKNKLQGNEAAARTALAKAEADLANTKNKQLQAESPILIENLRKLGVKLDEEAKTEQAKQSAFYAGAEESRAGSRLKGNQAKLLEDQHEALVRIEKSRASMSEQQYKEQVLSEVDRLEKMYNEGLVSKAQVDAVHEAAEKARKENTMYYWNELFDKIERVNRGVNAWFSVTNY